jgi:OmpA-OmpF porin, OOP family
MRNLSVLKRLFSIAVPLYCLSVLVGCVGQEVAPDGIWYPNELASADRAVKAAMQAGKDKECPTEFKAAEKLKNDAYATWRSCRTKEAIAMAIEAESKTNALCPKKAPPPPPPAAPAPAPAPTASISASPASIPEGQCTTLTWSSSNATSASIDQGVGKVDLSGSRQVCPDKTTQYTIAAAGGRESGSASTTVTVRPKVIDRLTVHVNFDFNKSDIRKSDLDDLQKAVDFVKKYPDYKISIEGHTDSIGTPEYNQGLSERRAAAVKAYLLSHGVADGARIRTAGFGETKPIADNKTKEGRFQNRRVEILILSD